VCLSNSFVKFNAETGPLGNGDVTLLYYRAVVVRSRHEIFEPRDIVTPILNWHEVRDGGADVGTGD
jgi:hypothetical protein